MDELAFTGERFLSHLDYPEIAYEHWHRYLYASGWVAGKTVLDIACGEGYGSYFLAQTARRVVGVDISPEAVMHASTHYLSANLEFKTGSVDQIPLAEAESVDVIVSFETLEHVPAETQQAFLLEVKRLLKPRGVLIISTPNKYHYSDVPQYKNEYHVHEFYIKEFHAFLAQGFKHVEVLGQKIFPASVIWHLEQNGRAWREHHLEQTNRGLQPSATPKKDIYNIAVCSNAPLVGVDNALLLDLSERIWRLRDQQLALLQQKNQSLEKQLAEKNTELERLQAGLTKLKTEEPVPAKNSFPKASGQRDQIEPLGAASRPQTAVSIIIPLFNQAVYTRQCLEALAQNTPADKFELILVDNASTDATPELLRCLEGDVQVIRHEKNEGFVNACNRGAQAAKGKYLLFLNNDTVPLSGWLEAMLRLAESDPVIGAVGAKLMYPDGKLQEAGALIFNDGSGWNFGRGDDPAKAAYNRVAEVDYCSGACLLVRRNLFEQLQGFDKRYVPAYYEDTDLCFGLRKLGFKVMYCPEAAVVHFEGVTAGTNLQTGYKKYQALHRETFARKWKRELQHQDHSPEVTRQAPVTADRARLRALPAGRAEAFHPAGPNVLVIDPTLPMHDRASGCLRLFGVLKIMRQQGCAVTFIARSGGPTQYRRELESMGIRVYGPDPAKITNSHAPVNAPPVDLRAILSKTSFQVAWLSFFQIAEEYLAEIRQWSPATKIVIDTVDVHFLREERQAELLGDDRLRQQAKATRLRELEIYRRADALVTVTAADQSVLEGQVTGKPMFVVPNVHARQPNGAPYEQRQGLLFVGNFNHLPNQDAMLFFALEVFPKIRAILPEVKLQIIGNNPPAAIQNLAGESIQVTGYVPETKPYLNLSRISVAPLRYGAGMKGKIGEALSHGVPVVTTSIGAEGMGLVPDEHVLIADDAGSFAQAVVRLYQDRELWLRLAKNGRRLVESNFTPEAIAPQVKAVLGATSGPERTEALTSLVILTHNQRALTQACLESVLRHTHEPFELIVVDNASTDDTVAYLSSWEVSINFGEHKYCRRFTLVSNPVNRGFAAGNNQGIAAAQGDTLVLMNNDVVVTPGWLTRLLRCAQRNPKIGVVGPMTNYVSGPQKVETPGYRLDTLEGLDDFARDFAREHADEAFPHWRVVGFCMLIKREVIEKIGGLDGRFGLGNFEDDDFSLRAALAKFESWIARDCYVHHVGSRTFADLNLDYRESLEKNWRIFKNKWRLPAAVPLGTSVDLTPILRGGFKARHYCAYR
ncbi:MAG: glycosyltransferase [Candidatus Firestonebacteria bacterium]|nr:glycosyltransferase [Candidatus Firestonebacteria bacterium]